MTNSEKNQQTDLLPNLIRILRGKRVILDRDLATLYGVQTRDLNKSVKRNLVRFPEDFAFQLTLDEAKILMFQNGTSSWGGTRKPPYAFTEHGVAMLASLLKSERAISVSIQIVRLFIKLRDTLLVQNELAIKVQKLEETITEHDQEIGQIFQALNALSTDNKDPIDRTPIGFQIGKNDKMELDSED